jgi:hypothetical protein
VWICDWGAYFVTMGTPPCASESHAFSQREPQLRRGPKRSSGLILPRVLEMLKGRCPSKRHAH